MFNAIHSGLQSFSRFATWVGGAALLLSAIMVTADVVSRKIFGITMSGSDEITGYVFAAATTWAYSYCLFTRSNIRIDVLYNQLGTRTRGWLDLLGLSLLTYYVYLLSTNALSMFRDNLEYNSTAQTTLATPLWIPQSFWISGLFFFLFCLSFMTLYVFISIIQGRWDTVNRIAGVKSVEEEIKEETHA